MQFFKKIKLKIIKFEQMLDGRLGDITRNTRLINEKIDQIDTGEGVAIKIFEELIKTREELAEELSRLGVAFVELKEEQEGMGKIMGEFISLQSMMIEKMAKYFALETKAAEMSMTTTPPKPTEHDKIF